MTQAFKTVQVCHPKKRQRHTLSYEKADFRAASEIYLYLMENDAVITALDGFDAWETKLLCDCKTCSGGNLYVGEHCCLTITDD
jgi:hypothetical protein